MQNFWCKNPQAAAEAVRCRWPKSAEHTIFIADEICRGRYLFPHGGGLRCRNRGHRLGGGTLRRP